MLIALVPPNEARHEVNTHMLSVTDDGAIVMSDDRQDITRRLP